MRSSLAICFANANGFAQIGVGNGKGEGGRDIDTEDAHDNGAKARDQSQIWANGGQGGNAGRDDLHGRQNADEVEEIAPIQTKSAV